MSAIIDGIPVDQKEVPCRFNHESNGEAEIAVARYAFSRGCACFPDDREQDLCAQHAIKAEPLGTMQVILIYHPEMWKWLNDAIHSRNTKQ